MGRCSRRPECTRALVYFDWDNKETGGQDGIADHVGIVEKVINNMIYVIEGNSNDRCAERIYHIGYSEILGYGVMLY